MLLALSIQTKLLIQSFRLLSGAWKPSATSPARTRWPRNFFQRQRREDQKNFYCPSGHTMWYPKG